ncbi:hypothetical protein NCAS_0A04420 [Naumovozyma castellii]|uniref:Vacuolar ATPase assembly integral membrane protein VPH2 n=1 Tax=Naumovozyma castellii TaxID=27288 RepID=G0V6A8_NAUCA|nr:hypothetical protein NCAS_0A04420 [Naumovozyma castellii CBS 4309]CCC67000.1 hypothetical protein NCAS_0A04420 [Naumovozyma castellii CBS 4309]
MFDIKLNVPLKEALGELKEKAKDPLRKEIDTLLNNGYIPMKTLLKYHSEYWKNQIPMRQLLNPIEFQFKEKYQPGSTYSPEFKKQLETLKLKQEELDYQNMIKNERKTLQIIKEEGETLTPAQMNKQIKEQVTTIFNIFVSVISVVFAIWYWTGTSAHMPVHYRLLLCIFTGILVLVAEVVVYNSYLTKIDLAKSQEKKKKEQKKVLKKIVL